MRALVVFCEGSHDVAFLKKLLEHDGFNYYSKKTKISAMPSPLNKIFEQRLKNFAFEYLDLFTKKPTMPEIMEKDGHLVLLYIQGGDSGDDFAKETVRSFRLAMENAYMFPNSADSVREVKFAFVYDCDHHGTEERKKEIKERFGDLIAEDDRNLFLFSGSDGYGALEDILIPLMRESNETLFDEAQRLIEIYGKGTKYPQKSLIGIVGQMAYSGVSNAVIIGDKNSHFFNEKKLSGSDTVDRIIQFIQGAAR